ncbi:MAG: HAD-IIB family hydrolase [Ardenticatenaceae bacterium]
MNTIYISDLDGTLLTKEATLSDFTRSTLSHLLHEGLTFTVASARSVASMRPILTGLNLRLPIIEFNGAFISDLESGHHHIINHIERAIIEEIYEQILTFGCLPFVSSFNGTEDCLYYQQIINEGMQWYVNKCLEYKDKRLRAIGKLSDSFADQVVSLTVIDQVDVLLELESSIKEKYGNTVNIHLFENQYSPGWYWLTVQHHRATKAQAIQTLLQTFALHDHELVVFGDHNNDLEMFQLANRALAVTNATAELKRHATHLIGSHIEDSVVTFIRDDWTEKLSNKKLS